MKAELSLALRKTQEREEMINCWADAICLFEQLNELNNRSMALTVQACPVAFNLSKDLKLY